VTRIAWDAVGTHRFETGVANGVLYPVGSVGVPWNGLISITENVSGGEASSIYLDGKKYLDIVGNEDFEATLEAFSAPPEFNAANGAVTLAPGLFATQQPRKLFGLSYKTIIGNDLSSVAGYKLHLVYNVVASPSAKTNKTLDANPDPATLSWTVHTVPPSANGYKPTAHLTIDSTLASPTALTALEDLLYGQVDLPFLPDQALVITTLAS
jgi:hypothetical protein